MPTCQHIQREEKNTVHACALELGERRKKTLILTHFTVVFGTRIAVIHTSTLWIERRSYYTIHRFRSLCLHFDCVAVRCYSTADSMIKILINPPNSYSYAYSLSVAVFQFYYYYHYSIFNNGAPSSQASSKAYLKWSIDSNK